MSDPTPATKDLRVFVGDLLRRPGSRRDLELDTSVPELGAGLVHADGPGAVHLGVALEAIAEGIVVHGTAEARWHAECARCLEDFAGRTHVPVDELFEQHPTEGDTYPLEGEEIDLEQMLRDVLLTEFPLAPVPPRADDGRCSVCGRLPADLPIDTEPPSRDERWSALDQLDL
jgi:uncharacterized protein